MDILGELREILVCVVAGGMNAIGLVAAYLVNARTREKVLRGSQQQKLVGYCLRIGTVLVAYAVVLLSAKALHDYTDRTLFDALLFFSSLGGILLLARIKQRRGVGADKRTRTKQKGKS